MKEFQAKATRLPCWNEAVSRKDLSRFAVNGL